MAHVLTSEKVFPRMVDLRRYLHRHPELAFEEKKTASIVIDELKRLGIPFWYGGVGSGIIAKLINAGQGAPTIALRADVGAAFFDRVVREAIAEYADNS